MLRYLSISVLIVPATALASDINLDAEIETARERGYAYYSLALELDPLSHMGSSLNGLGYSENICAIVGRALGVDDSVLEKVTFEELELSPLSDPNDLMTHSYILDSWVAAAETVRTLTDAQRVSLWNLECVGYFEIPQSAAFSQNEPSDFSMLDGRIYVHGDIDSGFFERFRSFLDENPDATEVMLGSAGGSVIDALMAGVEIRIRGLDTTLFGSCFSACPLVYAGGVRRTVWAAPGQALGFHQIYNEEGAIPTDHVVYENVRGYLESMGVDSLMVVSWMLSAPPSELYIPEFEDLCLSELASWVHRVCSSD